MMNKKSYLLLTISFFLLWMFSAMQAGVERKGDAYIKYNRERAEGRRTSGIHRC